MMSICTVSGSVAAAPISGVTESFTEFYDVKNDVTSEGKVVGATVNSPIYSDASCTTVVNHVVKNQIIRALAKEGNLYKIPYEKDVAYVKVSDFVSDNELLKYVVQNPSWYKQEVYVTKDTTAYDWVTGGLNSNVREGSLYQLAEDAGDYYTAIRTELDADGNDMNSLINISKSDSKLQYNVHVTDLSTATTMTDKEMSLVEYACSLVGTPYVWGGTDPATGVDCSGFVGYVYKHFGYSLPRCSWQQAEVGTKVSLDDLQPGDLVFYMRGARIGHVTMYIGDGQCVQARSRIYGVCITPVDYSKPLCAVRIIE